MKINLVLNENIPITCEGRFQNRALRALLGNAIKKEQEVLKQNIS